MTYTYATWVVFQATTWKKQMIKYLCSDCENGAGNMVLADTPQDAFEEYKAYWRHDAQIEDMYIYRITAELKGKAMYTFEEVREFEEVGA